MKSLKHLLDTKAPSHEKLLDIALILSIVPHLFVMKGFMLIYVAIALFFILKKKKNPKNVYILMGIGVLLLLLSFFNNYNFSDFSKMQFFVSFVSSMLIFAISLQRLTQEVNKYLKISPALLMLLSFFFFDSLFMLFYALFTLFVFTLMLIWSRMDAPLGNVLRLTSKLFLLALPAVLIMFLAFPRISFDKAQFGFKADEYAPIGYTGKMRVTSKEIKLSNKPVMEVSFDDPTLLANALYFRGSTLSVQNGLEWIPDTAQHSPERLVALSNPIKYDLTIYPHAQEWIYALEMPTASPSKATLESDFTLKANKPIYDKRRYRLQATQKYKIFSKDDSNTLKVDKKKNEKTFAAIKSIRVSKLSDIQKAHQLMKFFKDQNLSYTLKPEGSDLEDFTDSFLFDSKNGYCVHFASAFAESARMLGIPSRVVTGFQAEKREMINNYLIVKQSDAHAWVELYIKKQGWVRFDPTATASRNLDIQFNSAEQESQMSTFFKKINKNFMYIKYTLESAILDYNRLKQMAILEKLLSDTLYLMKFILAILGVVLLSFLLFFSIKLSSCADPLVCEMQKLLKLLKKHNLEKKESESMFVFLQRAEETLGMSLSKISTLYHELKYAKNQQTQNISQLQEAIKEFKKRVAISRSTSL